MSKRNVFSMKEIVEMEKTFLLDISNLYLIKTNWVWRIFFEFFLTILKIVGSI